MLELRYVTNFTLLHIVVKHHKQFQLEVLIQAQRCPERKQRLLSYC